MHEAFCKVIEAARAENASGVVVRGGKRYTSVAVRVEIARRHFGDAIGIETEIVQWGAEKGTPIVVKATVRRPDGSIISSGYAEEIRGQGQVNSTSALENAETSAIGRALASLGLSGGEFASVNELDGVERKSDAKKETSRPDGYASPGNDRSHATVDGAAVRSDARPLSEQAAPAGPREERVLTKQEGEAIILAINGRKSWRELDEYMDALGKGPMAFAATHPKIKVAVAEKRAAFQAADPVNAPL